MSKCLVEGCYNSPIVTCICGKCLAYCQKHIHLYKDDNFICISLKSKDKIIIRDKKTGEEKEGSLKDLFEGEKKELQP